MNVILTFCCAFQDLLQLCHILIEYIYEYSLNHAVQYRPDNFNPLKPELNPICYLLALLGAHHFLHVSRIRVKLLTLR